MGPARSQRFQFQRSTNEKPPAGVPGVPPWVPRRFSVGSVGVPVGSGRFRVVPREVPLGVRVCETLLQNSET